MNAIEAKKLIEIFQLAIVELSAKLLEEKETLSRVDVDNTKFVMGMASLNSANLARAVKLGILHYEDNKEDIDRLFIEAAGFAKALQAEGYGRCQQSSY